MIINCKNSYKNNGDRPPLPKLVTRTMPTTGKQKNAIPPQMKPTMLSIFISFLQNKGVLHTKVRIKVVFFVP